MGIRLYIGNLPFNITEAELREHFSTVGPLSYLSIPTDRETGKQRGFAFLEYKDRVHADEAIRRFNNQAFRGRSLSVSEARARDESPRAAPTRPTTPRPASSEGPDPANPRGNKPGRNFGPDAPSRHGRGKSKGEFRSERGPKRPMREIVRGQFSSHVDEYDEDDDYDDYEAETDGENFDAGAPDPEEKD